MRIVTVWPTHDAHILQVVEAVKKAGVNLTTVLTTHHHWYKLLPFHSFPLLASCSSLLSFLPLLLSLSLSLFSFLLPPPSLPSPSPSCRDHAGGNKELFGLLPDLTVCGNDDRIEALNKRVKHNDKFNVSVATGKFNVSVATSSAFSL